MSQDWTKDKEVQTILRKYRTNQLTKDEALAKIRDYGELLKAGKNLGIDTDLTSVKEITEATRQGRVADQMVNPELRVKDWGIGTVPRGIDTPASLAQMEAQGKVAYDGGIKANTQKYLLDPQLRNDFNKALMNNITDGILFWGL